MVGDDYPFVFIEALSQRHIDTSEIDVVKGGKTFFWSGKYHNDMNLCDTFDTGVDGVVNQVLQVEADFFGGVGPVVEEVDLAVQVQRGQAAVFIKARWIADCLKCGFSSFC